MEEKKELSNCATCQHNKNNYCKSSFGYYFRGETIIDEMVPCDDWEVNYDSMLFKLDERINFKNKKQK